MRSSDRFFAALSAAGLLVFLVGYAIAITLYPGGTHLDPSHPGYDLADNYLCDAFRGRAYDGRPNVLGAKIGQVGMLGLVVAAAAALLAAPGTFRAASPRLSVMARVLAALAFAGMLLVPLTPAHEYGMLHFAAVGLAAIPSLAAAYASAFGVHAVLREDEPYRRAFGALTIVALVACTLHFAQYLAQVMRLLGETVWVPRAQKLVVAIVVAWIAALIVWVRSRDRAGPGGSS